VLDAETIDNEAAARIGREIVRGVLEKPFGSLSKTEIDNELFRAMVDSGTLDIRTSKFDLAYQLAITPARANTLVYTYRMRQAPDTVLDAIVEALAIVTIDTDAKEVVLQLEDRFLRDALIARLKEKDVYTDTSFNRELIYLHINKFSKFLRLFDKTTATELNARYKAAKKANKKLQYIDFIQGLPMKAASGAASKGGGTLASFVVENRATIQNLIESLVP
jgi:hypothetical protein